MTGYFIFGNIDTRTYNGIYVTFDDIDKTPKRVYEEVEIPSRNGKFYIDKERYEDVEHVYHVIAMTKENGSALINALASKVGYHRLEDGFNTSEYYEAVFMSGADIKITPQRDKNIFKVTFTRKPQRWLTSGETAVTVANNGTINNPTLFDSHPLLEIAGYGDFNIGGERITINTNGEAYGELLLANKTYNKDVPNREYASILDSNNYNLLLTGDDINVMSGSTILVEVTRISDPTTVSFSSASVNGGNLQGSVSLLYSESRAFRIAVTVDDFGFVKGTSATHTITLSLAFSYTVGGTTTNWSGTMPIEFKYNGTANKITYNIGTCTPAFPLSGVAEGINYNSFISSVYGNSTRLMSGTTYIDLDIGEAYMIQNNNVVSINNMVVLPAELPVLESGNNTITYDNTISSFKVTPRWWRV